MRSHILWSSRNFAHISYYCNYTKINLLYKYVYNTNSGLNIIILEFKGYNRFDSNKKEVGN